MSATPHDHLNPVHQEWQQLQHWLENPPQTPEEVLAFGSLYRKASARLAHAQTYFPDHEWTRELEQMVAKAHNQLYVHSDSVGWRRIAHFYAYRFPQLFHERFPFFLIAWALFAAGFFIAFLVTYTDSSFASFFLPEEWVRAFNPDFNRADEQWDHAMVSSEIMVNNIFVAFLCFSTGIFLGLGTVWSLFMNGLLIGGLAALYHRAGEGYGFWAFIWPHGVIELTAIFIAGAAGLALAYRLFVPGEWTRPQALIQEGKVVIQLIAGVVPMFVVAAIIEGFLTPAPWPHGTKYLIALITGIVLVAYLGRPFWRK